MTIILHWVLKRGDWLPEIPFTNYSTNSLLYHFISNEAMLMKHAIVVIITQLQNRTDFDFGTGLKDQRVFFLPKQMC